VFRDWTVNNSRRSTAGFSNAFPVEPGVLEVLDLIRHVAPVPHQFQISVSGFRVFCFLRCDVAFQRLYPDPSGRVVIRINEGQFRAFPQFDARRLMSGVCRFVFPRATARHKTYSHALISRSPR